MSCEDLERVIIDTDPEKFFQVGVQLPTLEKQSLIEFLRDNVDVFAWNACEALGIDPDFICHHLNANPSIIPRKQPPRRSSRDHYEAVKKKNGKWRVCVDFTNLNKACPKDPFPLSRINQLVDAIVDHP